MLLLVIWVLALTFFIVKFIVPSGEITYSSDFSKKTGFIYNLTPQERIDDSGDKVKIMADPVYFSLYYPRQFQEAHVKLKYKWENVDNQVLELGVLADKNLWQYQLKPLENTILERAIDTWDLSQTGDLIFLQKNKIHSSLDEFLASDVSRDKTAVYNVNINDLNIDSFNLDQEQTADIRPYIIDQDLIGHHQFYMYHPGDALKLTVKVQDLNLNKDLDKVELIIFYKDQVIAKESLTSIVSLESKEVSEIRDLKIALADLRRGLYKVQIKASDDIVIREIDVSSNRLVFINKLHLGKTNNNLNIYTDSQDLKVVTTKAASLQTIVFAGSSFEIKDTYKQHYLKTDTNLNNNWQTINIQKGEIELANANMFSFDKEFAFNPEMMNLDDVSDLNNIDYIIANYKAVKKEGEWNIATTSFDLSSAYSEDNKYSFLFSLPNFSYKQDSTLVIDSIEISLKGKNIWQKLKEIIK
jgi:hypothetical protein